MEENKLTYTRAQELFDIPSKKLEVDIIKNALNKALGDDKNLLGVSGPQVGKDVRVIALRFTDGVHYFFNPLGAKFNDFKIVIETWEGKKYLHPRFNKIEFCYQKDTGIPEQLELTDYPAWIFQQQLDLLDGITTDNLGIEVDDDFFNADEETQNAMIAEYITYLQNRQKALNEEIEEDPALRDRQRAIDFYTSVMKGETTLSSTYKKPNRATRRAQAKQMKKLAKEMEKANKLEEKSNDRKESN